MSVVSLQPHGPTEIRAAAALTASAVASGIFASRGINKFDLQTTLTARDAITRLDWHVQYSNVGKPDESDDDDWVTIQSEVDTTGVKVLSDVTYRKTIAAVGSWGFTFDAKGLWMRVKVFAGVGTPTASSASMSVIPRE